MTVHHLAGEINEEFKKAVMPVTVFIGLEIVVGIFGNFLVLYVYLFRYYRCNFRYFVLCLAIIDISCCFTAMPGELVALLYWYVYPGRGICKVKSFFNVFLACAEGLCFLTVAVDRYRKVCRPFRWQITPNSAKCLCGVIFLAALIMATPYLFLWGTSTHQYKYRNQTVTVKTCGKDSEFRNTEYPLTYSIVVEVIMSCTLISMLGLYIFTARRLLSEQVRLDPGLQTLSPSTSTQDDTNKPMTNEETEIAKTDLIKCVGEQERSRSNEKGSTNSKPLHKKYCKGEANLRVSCDRKPVDARIRRMTVIMLILTTIFITTAGLYLGLLFFIAGSNEHLVDDMSNSSKATYFFFMRLYFINHVMNPIVYISLDPHFRKVLKNLRKRLLTACFRR